MANTPDTSNAFLTVNQADLIARSISDNLVGVVRRADERVYLIRAGSAYELHLRPEQLTVAGIQAVVLNNDPWPKEFSKVAQTY